MQGHYINLESANTRRKNMESQISTSSLLFPINRFQAINGRNISGKLPSLSDGQWGCWLSHLSIIKSSLSNSDNLLIIEDDEYFDSMLNHALAVANDLKNNDWDLLYLDLTIVEAEDYLLISRILKDKILTSIKPFSLKVPKDFTAYGTHAYIINGKSKNKVFNYLNASISKGLPIDNIFCHGIQEEKISAYIALPLLASPGSETTKSQISYGNHPLEEDWINFRKLVSIYEIRDNFSEYLSTKIEVTSKKIINNRLDFSFHKKFNPT